MIFPLIQKDNGNLTFCLGYVLDINECNGPNPCNWKTSLKCVDYDGGYKCDCKAGYYNEKENSCKGSVLAMDIEKLWY